MYFHYQIIVERFLLVMEAAIGIFINVVEYKGSKYVLKNNIMPDFSTTTDMVMLK